MDKARVAELKKMIRLVKTARSNLETYREWVGAPIDWDVRIKIDQTIVDLQNQLKDSKVH